MLAEAKAYEQDLRWLAAGSLARFAAGGAAALAAGLA